MSEQKTKIFPYENIGTFTSFPNAILDHVMPRVAPNTWKIICSTIRQTLGWRKEEDWISVTQYMRLTGIKNRTTCVKAIQDALKGKHLVRRPYRKSFKYSLNKEYELDIGTETVTPDSTESVISNSTDSVNTKETNTKETSTKEKRLKFSKDEKDAFIYVVSEVTGVDVGIRSNYGWIAKESKELFEAGYSASDVSEHFGKGGTWYSQNWKGQKNQKPTTKDIRSHIKDYCAKHSARKYDEGKYAEFIET